MSADKPKFYAERGWGDSWGTLSRIWQVWKRSKGGDRWMCDASSERTARLIAKALNAQEAES